MSGPQVFPGSSLCLGRQDLVRLARLPGSEGPGCVIVDQVLCVLSGGNSGAGRCGRRVVAAAVTAEALSLTLEEDIPQDGDDHYDGDDQEHSNGHLYRAWERTGRMRHAKGLSGSDPPPSLHRMDKDHGCHMQKQKTQRRPPGELFPEAQSGSDGRQSASNSLFPLPLPTPDLTTQ